MAMVQNLRKGVIAICLGLAWHAQTAAAAGDASSPPQAFTAPGSAEIGQRMKLDEPMQGGMMKPGMVKGDVRKSAARKDEEMNETLEQEAESMPPMPEQKPREK